MTQDGLMQLAERARAEHMSVLGLTGAAWHLATPAVRNAWLAAVALVVSELKGARA